MSLSQTQHGQIWDQWPNSVPKNDHLYYDRKPAQNTPQNGRTHENKIYRHS